MLWHYWSRREREREREREEEKTTKKSKTREFWQHYVARRAQICKQEKEIQKR